MKNKAAHSNGDTSWIIADGSFVVVFFIGFFISRALTETGPTASSANALGQHVGLGLAPLVLALIAVALVWLVQKARRKAYIKPRKHASILAVVFLVFTLIGTV